ncbi:GIY-YIG nuclease family protein, partial [uncultured Desulfovibrio sp.]|uniref:GIY-YIG nuclease family protein n=1 Tax=uncultured Desulfovibrio sp. TaxID=167968 RepID=UPI00345E84C5
MAPWELVRLVHAHGLAGGRVQRMSAAPLRADGGGSGETFWHVYLLECRDGTLYCGITRDPERRVA